MKRSKKSFGPHAEGVGVPRRLNRFAVFDRRSAVRPLNWNPHTGFADELPITFLAHSKPRISALQTLSPPSAGNPREAFAGGREVGSGARVSFDRPTRDGRK